MCDLASPFLYQLMVIPLEQYLPQYYINLVNSSILKLSILPSNVVYLFRNFEGDKKLGV